MVQPEPVKRANGTRWRVRFRLAGARNATSETFSSRDEAQRFIDLAVRNGSKKAPAWHVAREIRHGSVDTITRIPPLRAFFLDTYLPRVAASRTSGTVAGYRGEAERSWLTMLGDWPLDMITRDLVLRWLTWQREQESHASRRARDRARVEGRPLPAVRPVSTRTVRGYQRLLSQVLGAAVEDGLIARNVARGVEVPDEHEREEMVFLTPAEFAAVYACVPDQWRPLVAILGGTGMRWGEATALQGRDFDLDADVPVVRVSRAWKKGADGPFLGAPKSRAGRRTISLGVSVVAAVRESVEAAPGDALVFTSAEGSRVRSQNFLPRVWRPAVEASGIAKRPRVHDLRHSHLSHLIAQGVPLPVIQRRAGHESITTTVGTYGHLMPDALMQVADAAEAALAGAIPPPRPALPPA